MNPEESSKELEADEHPKRKNLFYKCCTCRYDNGTVMCKKREKDHKVSLCHEYNPYNYCPDYKPNWKKVFPKMRQE